MQYEKIAEGIFVIHQFLSPERCQKFIDFTENQGYGDLIPDTGFKTSVIHKELANTSNRNNERIIHTDITLAKELWELLKDFAPKETEHATSIGLNERFRFYKYHVGQQFKRHTDGRYIRNMNEWSSYTFMVYLNEVEEGGETNFYEHSAKKSTESIKPAIGKALIFDHSLVHEGAEVLQGLKYVLRSDVMYRRKNV